MSEQLILWDLPSKDKCQCWSLNPWKTRMLLNYKGIDYKTEWIEYPDIKPKFENLVPKNDTRFGWSIPTVKFPDGTYMSESRNIADKIEQMQPSPSVHLDSKYLARLMEIMPGVLAMAPEFINKVPKRLLNEASLPHWYKTRTGWFNGKPLDQVEKEDGGDKAFKAIEPIINEVGDLLRENQGPFFEGHTVTYADFVWASYLRFLERIGDDVWNGFLKHANDGHVHTSLLEACRPWMKRDDH